MITIPKAKPNHFRFRTASGQLLTEHIDYLEAMATESLKDGTPFHSVQTGSHALLKIALEGYNPEALYPLDCLEFDVACPAEIEPEIELLIPPLLNAKSLANLQLEKIGESKRKRAGSFYTPPELAAYITGQTIPATPDGAIIDHPRSPA